MSEIKSRIEFTRLGAFLRKAREQKAMTQVAVAERAGLTQPEICRLELANAKNGPQYVTILKYLEACGLSLTIAVAERTTSDLVIFVDSRTKT